MGGIYLWMRARGPVGQARNKVTIGASALGTRAGGLGSWLLCAVVLLFLAAPAGAEGLPRAALVVTGGDGRTHRFEVEVASSPAEQALGLMHRAAVPEGTGMLFDFGTPRLVSMWMKDTLVPLDMLFIDKAGRVVKVAARTVPLSLDVIDSGMPVRAVLELAGGTAARLGIGPGAVVAHQAFGNRR